MAESGRMEPGGAATAADGQRFDEAAQMLRVLSHPVRLRIIKILSSGELCVKRLEEILGISQPSVSQHLSKLRYAGLIESERRGHLVCYRLADRAAMRVLKAALEKPEAAGGSEGSRKGERDHE
jgi:ArsR family transcriptional regulator